jgi:hypothetical protein
MIPLLSKNKTDKSKRHLFSFGGKLLTDKKLPPLFSRSIFNPTHHSLPFLVLFLAVGMDLVGKCCGGNLGLSVVAKKSAKNSGRVYFYASQLLVVCITTPGCARASRKKNIVITRQSMMITRQGD